MSRQTVEECLTLDVLELARAGLLVEGTHFRVTWELEGEIAFVNAHVEDGCLFLDQVAAGDLFSEEPFPVEISHTLTPFGAERLWFFCPTCGEERRKLYLPPGRYSFLCRACHSLTYASCRQPRSGFWKQPAAWRMLVGELLLQDLLADEEARMLAEIKRLHLPPSRPPKPPRDTEPLPPAPKRPRGRPKQKRPYHRQKPFLSGERPSDSAGLCLRCRDWRELTDAQAVTLPNGRSARQGTCPICGARITLIRKD